MKKCCVKMCNLSIIASFFFYDRCLGWKKRKTICNCWRWANPVTRPTLGSAPILPSTAGIFFFQLLPLFLMIFRKNCPIINEIVTVHIYGSSSSIQRWSTTPVHTSAISLLTHHSFVTFVLKFQVIFYSCSSYKASHSSIANSLSKKNA